MFVFDISKCLPIPESHKNMTNINYSKGAFINTSVGMGLGKTEGDQKSFDVTGRGGDQKVFSSKEGGSQKSLVKLKV